MKRTSLFIIAGVVGAAALNLLVLSGRATGSGDAPPPGKAGPRADAAIAAGPGLVEPSSEEVRVATQVGGTLREVLVEEGDEVTAGQVVAGLENADYRARASAAEAELRLREAEARRVRNGARVQERQESVAAVHEAEAVLDLKKADLERMRELARELVISRQELERAEQDARVAQARLDAARERASFVAADAREEDQARADSEVALARARLDEARALLTKTVVTSPIDGIVLRRYRKAGESVSTQFDSPILTLADRSSLRVRIDVDETDVAKIAVGQPAYVTADAFGSRRFTGHVMRVGRVLGRKNFRTDEPTEHVDTKILETLVQLDDGHELPIGLRVQAFVFANW